MAIGRIGHIRGMDGIRHFKEVMNRAFDQCGRPSLAVERKGEREIVYEKGCSYLDKLSIKARKHLFA